MTKHTPKPWFTDFNWQAAAIEAGAKPPYKYIAILTHNTEEHSTPQCAGPDLTEEQKANARLIAAAPELLAALKRARRFLIAENNCNDPESDEFHYNRIQKEIDIADHAIAKAEGGTS